MGIDTQRSIYNERVVSLSTDFSYIESYSLKIIKNIFLKNKIKTVCDIGCGTGKYLNHIAEIYNIEKGKGYDISEKSVETAIANKKSDFVDFKVYDGFTFDEEKYDFIMINHVLEHVDLSKRKDFLEKVKSLMHEKTILFIAVPNRRSFPEIFVSIKQKIKGVDIRSEVGHENMSVKKDYDQLISKMFNDVKKDYDYSFSYRRMGTYVPLAILFMPYKIIEKISIKIADKYARMDNVLTKYIFKYFSLSFYYIIKYDCV